METYKQLACEERYQISAYLKAGFNQMQIALELDVHKSTISREVRRNRGLRGYRPKQANEMAIARRSLCSNAVRITDADWKLVDACLQEKLSPEQISGRLACSGALMISPEHIYRYVYRDKRAGGDLVTYLRGQKPYRKRYGSGDQKRGAIKNRVSIDERPPIVAEKTRIGDWEGDLVIGKDQQGALVTMAERVSRYTLSGLVKSKHAEGVTAVIQSLLEPHRDRCHTITLDNGKEFAGHETFAAGLDAAVFFAHPYHSWERGLNENTNGLIRQYFPKSTDLLNVTPEQVTFAINQMNHRPRKCLDWKTPHEVFFGQPSTWSMSALNVALRM
jgi:IS30 family transposase